MQNATFQIIKCFFKECECTTICKEANTQVLKRKLILSFRVCGGVFKYHKQV